MRSILDIVRLINKHLDNLLPGLKTYGIAQLVPRDTETLPAEGEKYIGLDDIHSAQVYHKINGMTITRQARGFGDKVDQLYTYQMSMIVFLAKPFIRPEDLVPLLQNALPQQFKTDYTKRVSINFLSAILNDQQVFAQEYKNTSAYRLDLNQHLFQVNYSLEVLYKPGCFDVCPEELNCKN